MRPQQNEPTEAERIAQVGATKAACVDAAAAYVDVAGFLFGEGGCAKQLARSKPHDGAGVCVQKF